MQLKPSRRDTLVASAALLLGRPCILRAMPRENAATTFRPMKLGAGGFVTDIDISPDGDTRLIRTDVYGCYIWSTESDSRGRWKQLVTKASMVEGVPRFGESIGCYAVCCAPGQPERIYMATSTSSQKNDVRQTVFRSDDRGRTFRKTALRGVIFNFEGPNFALRLNGPKMAVDPRDADTVFIADIRGRLFRTLDGGAHWRLIEGAPQSEAPTLCFDPDGATLYFSSGPHGIWSSRDRGETWARIPGGPAKVIRMVADARKRLWATEANVGGRNAWRLRDGQWTKLTPQHGEGWQSIAIEPHAPEHICLGNLAGNIDQSFDGGDTWTGFYPSAPERAFTDIPWLAWTMEDWFSNANMTFDPVEPNTLWCAQGIGVWRTNPKRSAARPKWEELSRGIDELIVNTVLKPPGGPLVIACQDRAFFKLQDPDRYPSVHGPARDAPIRHGWGLDYATDDPSFIVGVAGDKSGFSQDGGATWTPFASLPSGDIHWGGGAIAAASRKNFVWFPANNRWPHFTRDGGVSWSACKFPSPAAEMTKAPGWAFSFYTNRHILCVERSTGFYYAYNYEAWSPADIAGVWRSTDGGETWRRMGRGFGVHGSMGTGAKLVSVPGYPGHLLFAVGATEEAHPYNASVYRTQDGGASWRPIPGFVENWTVGVGKAAPGLDYPALYVAGIRDGVHGIFRSNDRGETWTALADDYGTLDGVRDLTGDMDDYGSVYVGLAGSGVLFGSLSVRRT